MKLSGVTAKTISKFFPFLIVRPPSRSSTPHSSLIMAFLTMQPSLKRGLKCRPQLGLRLGPSHRLMENLTDTCTSSSLFITSNVEWHSIWLRRCDQGRGGRKGERRKEWGGDGLVVHVDNQTASHQKPYMLRSEQPFLASPQRKTKVKQF